MIIVIVGMCGTGKSTVVDLLGELTNYSSIYLGGFVFEELDKMNLARNSVNEQFVKEKLRKEKGKGVLAKLVIEKISSTGSENFILDGVYSFDEYSILKGHYKDDIKFVAILADKALRYNRLSKREERSLSKCEVDKRDIYELKLRKGDPIALADFYILNNSTKGKLKKQLSSLFNQILKGNF